MLKIIALLSSFIICLYSCAELLPLNPGEVAINLPGGRKVWAFECGKSSRIKEYPMHDGGGLILTSYSDDDAGTGATFRKFKSPVDCRGFDRLIFFVSASGNIPVKLKLIAGTDKGVIRGERVIKGFENKNFSLYSFTDVAAGLKNAGKIFSLRLECEMLKPGRGNVAIPVYRIILRNDNEYKSYLKHFERFGKLKWQGLLKDESYQPEFKPLYSLLFNLDQLQEFRTKYMSKLSAKEKSIKLYAPETAISPTIRPPREEFLKKVPCNGVNFFNYWIAYYAIITKNKKLLHLAARHLLSLCAVESWGDGAYPYPPGGGPKTAFFEGRYGLDAALMLDWTGEMLTARGRDWVLRTLVMKAFAPVTYSEWSRPYCFKSNQGPTFIVAKLATLLCAEQAWKRVNAYTDLAVKELNEAMDFLFASDGSFMESKTYFSATIFRAIASYQMLASVRKKSLSRVIPDNLKKSGGYAQVIISSSKNPQRRLISIGQARHWNNFFPRAAAFMAAAVPGSLWVNLFRDIDQKTIASRMTSMRGMSMWLLAKEAASAKPGCEKNFVLLKKSGLCSSMRRCKGKKTKVVLVGDAINVGKKHHDVGSFILEFAGDIYAMDMPVYSGLLAEAQYHNMLVAVDENRQPANSLSFTAKGLYHNAIARNSMCPEGSGNDKMLDITVDPSPSWERKYFRKWRRRINSPNPDELTIVDEYTLGRKARGAAFIWNTYLPCKVADGKVVITGEYGSKCEISVPEGCDVSLDRFTPPAKTLKGMALPPGHKCTRVIIRKPGTSGKEAKLVTKVKLIH